VASQIIFWTLVGLVVLAPLPFGAVYEWTWTLMASIVGILLVTWSAEVVIAREKIGLGLRSTWPFVLPFALVAVWAAVQSLPITPDAWHHPLWDSAAAILGVDSAGSVSLNPTATRAALLRLLTYGGIFWLALHYCRETKRAQSALYALAIAGFAYAAYGLVVWFTGSKTILWYDRDAIILSSTFINRNNYATYAGLTLLVLSGLLLNIVSETLAPSRDRRKWLRRFLEVLVERGWILILGWMIVMTALLLTHSRAGFASTLLGLMLFCVAFGFIRGFKPRHGAAAAVLLLVVGTGFFVLSGEILSKRLAATSLEEEGRFRTYELTLEAIESAPLLGTGYGTFEEVFRFYQTPPWSGFWAQAHNTYLENALELGVPAALGLFGTVAGLFFLTVRGLRRRRMHAVYPCIGLAATVLVAAHSLLDFPLQIPAVAVTYSFLMGVCCAQAWSSRREPDPW
jgi:O-antigen ligase